MRQIRVERKPTEGQEIPVQRAVPCEIYSRVCGYLRPTSAWNAAKQVEFGQRVVFRVPVEVEDGE